MISPKITEKNTDSSPSSFIKGILATTCAPSDRVNMSSRAKKSPLVVRLRSFVAIKIAALTNTNIFAAIATSPPEASSLGMNGMCCGSNNDRASIRYPVNTIIQSSLLNCSKTFFILYTPSNFATKVYILEKLINKYKD